MREWMEVTDRYVEEYAARGMAAKTIERVEGELGRWVMWLLRRRPRPAPQEVEADLIVRYVKERTAFKSKATVAAVMGTLRGLGEFLVREEVWGANPLRWMRGPKLDGRSRVPRRLNREAMGRLWQAAATCSQAYRRYLWLAVLGVLYGTGARRGELVRMDVEDWVPEEGLVLLDGQKTGWERRVPVPELTGHCLEAYLKAREEHLARLGVSDETALFVNRWGGRLEGESLSRGVKRLAERAGVEGLTVHWFRHTCASDLLEAGASVAEVQEVLGHRAISTTIRYLHVADPQLHRAAELHPINAMLREETSDE